jgi:hypothetical protein
MMLPTVPDVAPFPALADRREPLTSVAAPAPLSPVAIARPARPGLRDGAPRPTDRRDPPDPRELELAMERYVETVLEPARRAALAHVHTLPEPRAPEDATFALRTLARLVEALAGFAVGAAIAPILQRLRRTAGADARREIHRALQPMLAPTGPDGSAPSEASAGASLTAPRPPFLADAEQRPLVDQLGRALCARLAFAERDACHLLRPLLASAAGARADATGHAIALAAVRAALSEAPWLAERFAAAISAAWRDTAALLHRTPPTDGPWAAFCRRAANLPEPALALTQADLVAAGFVLRIE